MPVSLFIHNKGTYQLILDVISIKISSAGLKIRKLTV